MISVSSVVSALFFYSGVLLLVCLLRVFASPLINCGGAFILLLLSAFATVRLLLPFEIPLTHLVRSWTLLGTPVRILRTYPNLTSFLLAAWAVGAALFASWDALTLYRAYKMSSGYRCQDSLRIQGIVTRCSISYPVVVSPDVGVPYVEGIFRHTIYFPILELPEEETEYALKHEVQHIRSHDSMIKFFFRLLLSIMWWNPFAHWFWHSLDDLLELRCDAKITKHMDKQERLRYGQALSHMAAVLTGKRPMSPLAVDEFFAVGRDKFIKERMRVILRGTGVPSRSARVAAVCVFTVLFCASYLVVFQPAIAPTEGKLENATGVRYFDDYVGSEIGDDVSNAFVIKGSDGQYQLFIDYEFRGFLTEDEFNSGKYENIFVFEEEKQK